MSEPTSSNYPASLDDVNSLGNDQKNLKQWSLSGNINASTPTIPTTATISGITAPFYIRIGTEIMWVTGISGADFTVVRGADGTTAASHDDGDPIYHIASANAWNQLRRAIIAIETELGVDPAGNFADVVTRLGQVDPRLVCGRLTLASGTPITTSDQTAKTTVYFTPYLGNKIAVYTGAYWKLYSFSEISVAVPSNTNTPFDIFIYDNSGTLTLEAVAWTNGTTRATALALQDGVYVKSGSTNKRYLGTGCTTGSSGQTEDSTSRCLLWNYYNRTERFLVAIDTTDSWTYSTATWRPANNDTNVGVGRVEVVVGVSEDLSRGLVKNIVVATSADRNFAGGIGVDVTNANSCQIQGALASSGVGTIDVAKWSGRLAAGFHFLQRLEIAQASGNALTWSGDRGLAYIQTGMMIEVMA